MFCVLLLGYQYVFNKVEAACKAAQIYDFIESQPDKWESKVKEQRLNFITWGPSRANFFFVAACAVGWPTRFKTFRRGKTASGNSPCFAQEPANCCIGWLVKLKHSAFGDLKTLSMLFCRSHLPLGLRY